MEYEEISSMINAVVRSVTSTIVETTVAHGIIPDPDLVYQKLVEMHNIIVPEYHAIFDSAASDMRDKLIEVDAMVAEQMRNESN